MRLIIRTTPSTEVIPWDYQEQLLSVFHRWAGRDNDLHDGISLYSYGWLRARDVGKTTSGIAFPRGAVWNVSIWDNMAALKFMAGMTRLPEMFFGMEAKSFEVEPDINFGSEERFMAASPILAREYNALGQQAHLLYNNPRANELLTQSAHTKLTLAGLCEKKLTVEFDHAPDNATTKLITIRGARQRGSLCPVILRGDADAIRFIYHVGVGHLTGCGFGALYYPNNRKRHGRRTNGKSTAQRKIIN